MSGAYGYGYEVNSGWKGYNNVYTLDTTDDNLLRNDTNAVPCCAQKRIPVPQVEAIVAAPAPAPPPNPILMYVGIAVLLMVIALKVFG